MQRLYLASLSFALSFVILFNSCTREEISLRNYPRLKTLEVSEITQDGATFNAEIFAQGSEAIVEMGFVWSTGPNPSIENSDKVIISESPDNVIFSFRISTSLIKDKTYWVRAFLKTQTKTVYGTTVSFKSLGSGSPKISNFSPSSGSWGDTISIVGSDFSFVRENNKVLFGEKAARIIEASDSTILAEVPLTLKNDSNIYIEVLGNRAVSSEKFKLMLPSINGISKNHILTFDTLLIKATNLGKEIDLYNVKFNGKSGTINSLETDGITVIAPPSLSNPLTVTVERDEVVYAEITDLIYREPSLTGVSPLSGVVGDTIFVTGKNLQGRNKFDSLYLNSIWYAAPFYESDSLLKFKLPMQINETSLNVKLETSGFSLEYGWPIFTKAPIIDSISPQIVKFNEVLTLSGTNFHPDLNTNTILVNGRSAPLLSGDINTIKFKLPADMTFDSTGSIQLKLISYNWRVDLKEPIYLILPQFHSVSEGLITEPNQSVFLNGQDFDTFNNFNIELEGYACSIISKTSSEIQFLIPPEVYEAGLYNELKILPPVVTINNQFKQEVKDSVRFLIRFHPFTKLKSFPGGERTYTYQFSSSTHLFVGGGIHDEGIVYNDLWNYDPLTNEWTQMPDLPSDPRYKSTSISIKNKGYVIGGLMGVDSNGSNSMFEFDFTSGSWKQLVAYPGSATQRMIAFRVNDNLHVAAGAIDSGHLDISRHDHYSYLHGSNVWQEKKSLFSDSNYSGIIPATNSDFSFGINFDSQILLYARNSKIQNENGGWSSDGGIKIFQYLPELDSASILNAQDFSFYSQFKGPNLAIDNEVWVHFSSINKMGRYNQEIWGNEFIDIPHHVIYGSFSQVINRKAYIGLGCISYKDFTDEIWEFDPSKL